MSYAETAATPDKDKVVLFEATPITDIDVLLERAKNGITDRQNESQPTPSVVQISNKALLQEDEFSLEEIEYYSTTQKIREIKQDQTTVETFSTTNFAILSADDKYQTKPDTSGGVVAYSTVSYDVIYANNLENYKLLSVTGGWNVHDSSISLSNRTVTYGASGNGMGGGAYLTQKRGPYTVSVNAFSYAAPSEWVYITEPQSTVGVTSQVTLSRGSSTWQLLFPLVL
ncbi:hypothetical protein [Paenibacillus sp.]|uniref:hypothetical protein n=1 Tax=Paenibacillus sp. TaxID=58172 RepID=UPI0028ACE9C1|nr:hypothetical protein [Paenibacillus sp.]